MSEKKEKMNIVLSFELCYDDKATRDAAAKILGDGITIEDRRQEEGGYIIHSHVGLEADQFYIVMMEIYKYVIYCSADKAYIWYFSPNYDNIAGIARTTQIEMIDHEVGVIPEFELDIEDIDIADNIGGVGYIVAGCEEEKKTVFEFVDGAMFEDEVAHLLWRMVSQEGGEFTEEEMKIFEESFPDEFEDMYFAG